MPEKKTTKRAPRGAKKTDAIEQPRTRRAGAKRAAPGKRTTPVSAPRKAKREVTGESPKKTAIKRKVTARRPSTARTPATRRAPERAGRSPSPGRSRAAS